MQYSIERSTFGAHPKANDFHRWHFPTSTLSKIKYQFPHKTCEFSRKFRSSKSTPTQCACCPLTLGAQKPSKSVLKHLISFGEPGDTAGIRNASIIGPEIENFSNMKYQKFRPKYTSVWNTLKSLRGSMVKGWTPGINSDEPQCSTRSKDLCSGHIPKLLILHMKHH